MGRDGYTSSEEYERSGEREDKWIDSGSRTDGAGRGSAEITEILGR